MAHFGTVPIWHEPRGTLWQDGRFTPLWRSAFVRRAAMQERANHCNSLGSHAAARGDRGGTAAAPHVAAPLQTLSCQVSHYDARD